MKILISGGTGFIGTNLIERLLKDGHTVYLVVRKTTKKNNLRKEVLQHVFGGSTKDMTDFMKREKFDGVIHLASLFLAQHTQDTVKDLIDSNVLFGTQLLDASVAAHIPWFINTGTFWQHYNNKKYSPVNLYSATKQAFEVLAQYYLETSSINFVTIKLCDTYGSSDTRPKIFNLLSKISTSKETLDMSPGGQLLNINHIDDVINGYMRMVMLISQPKTAKKLRGKSFAISAKKVISLKKLVTIFEKVTKTKLSINWGGRGYRPREVMVPWNKGNLIPGWKQSVSLEDGIKKSIASGTYDKN